MSKNELIENLWSFEDIAKHGDDNSKWIAIGSNGKEYAATFTRKYNPTGTMFFCIPDYVNILGYLQVI